MAAALVVGGHTVADGRVSVVQLVWSGGEVLIDVTHGGRHGKRLEAALSAWSAVGWRSAWRLNGQRRWSVVECVVGGCGGRCWLMCVVVRGGKPQDECQGKLKSLKSGSHGKRKAA